MTLDALHRKFSKDATYRRAYREVGEVAEVVLRCMVLREEKGLSKVALAKLAGVSPHRVDRFEAMHPASAEDVERIVRALEKGEGEQAFTDRVRRPVDAGGRRINFPLSAGAAHVA